MRESWDFATDAFGRGGSRPGESGTFIPNEVFVVMAFTSDLDDSFQAIQEGCASLQLRASRADDGVGSGIILDQIARSIREAEFVVVDLTHERPNVYYELGYAHGVGNLGEDVLLVARAGTALHFDISSLRVRFYSSPAELRDLTGHALRRMIQATRSYAQGGYRREEGGVFSLSLDTGAGQYEGGLAILHGGKSQGGDASCVYSGRYSPSGGSGKEIAGEFKVNVYRSSEPSLLAPLSHLPLPFIARQDDNDLVAEVAIPIKAAWSLLRQFPLPGSEIAAAVRVPGQTKVPLRVRGRRVSSAG